MRTALATSEGWLGAGIAQVARLVRRTCIPLCEVAHSCVIRLKGGRWSALGSYGVSQRER